MTRLQRLVTLALLGPVLSLVAHAADLESVIAKARRYVGAERDLGAVRTLSYRGEIKIGGTDTAGSIEMLLAKPCSQLTVRVMGDRKETVGYDGDEGWVRLESVTKPALSKIDIIPLKQLKLLRANVLENLAFYRGMEKQGVRIELRAETSFEGRAAVRVAFIHPGDIVFIRIFDQADGRLLLTEGPNGEVIREEGEVIVAGLRFPKRLVSSSKTPDGGTTSVTIDFTDIKVNEAFATELFAVPVPGSR